jgi:hypothetical protein
MGPLSMWMSVYGQWGEAAGIAAEAEGLQVAEVVRAALVPGHDGVHLQGSLVRGLPSNSRRRSIRSGLWRGCEHPDFDRAADLNLWPRRLAGLQDGRAADLEDLADLPGEARLSIDHLMHHGR